MLTLFFVLICIVSVLIFLLAVPIEINYEFSNRFPKKSITKVRWFFGLVNFKIEGNARNIDLKPEIPKRKKAKKKHKTPSRYKTGAKIFLAIIRSNGFLKQSLKLLRDVLTVAEIKQLQAQLGFGLGDPADTGRFYGLMSSLFAFLYAIPRVNFAVTPLFDRSSFEAEIAAGLKIVPIRFFQAILRFVFSKACFRAFIAATKAIRS